MDLEGFQHLTKFQKDKQLLGHTIYQNVNSGKCSTFAKTIKKGIFCSTFSNGQVSIGGGDFAFFVKSGYLIEDGKLTQPIKDANIIGNGPDALSKMDMIGNDMTLDEGGWTCGKDGQSVPVGVGLPTVLVSEMTVGGM